MSVVTDSLGFVPHTSSREHRKSKGKFFAKIGAWSKQSLERQKAKEDNKLFDSALREHAAAMQKQGGPKKNTLKLARVSAGQPGS